MRLALAIALAALASLASATPAPPTDVGVKRAGGINVEPSMRPWRYEGANPDGWWCTPGACRDVPNGTAFVDRELPLIKRLGVRTLRLEFPWPLIEPRRRAYDWRRADYIVAQASRAGLQLEAILVYTPPWAGDASQTSPPAARDWTAFARAFVRRYRARVRYVQFWDEPDSRRYWNGTQRQYVRNVLIPGYRAVKAVDPRAQVVLGPPSTPDVGWLEGIYKLGGGRFFDVMAYHDYSGNRQVLANARAVQAVLDRHGQRKPLWLGEYGFQGGGVNDVGHAELIRLVLTAKSPLDMAQWYSLRDDFPMTCCPPEIVLYEFYGLMTSDYRPKLSYGTMQKLLAPRR